MEEKKLTDEEVIEALACCVKGETCTNCPYFIKRIDCVYHRRAEGDALDLIHRLRAENEGQRKIIEYQDSLPDLVEQQKTEIERLTKENNALKETMRLDSKVYADLVVETNELQKQVDDLNEVVKDCQRLTAEKEQAIKDTAKEIANWLVTTESDKEDLAKIIKEHYGVEVDYEN